MLGWRGVIEEYRSYLPIAPGAPVVTLLEGGTPLVPAPRLSERVGASVYLKVEGANPTGSFKDRGMTVAISSALASGAKAVVCASTGNTSASAAAYASRAGLKCVVLISEGHIALGKLAQTLVHLSLIHICVALRYGLFYGPGAAGDALVGLLRRRRLPVARPAGVRPWLYIDDAVTATVAALERAGPGHAYNIVDDEPVSFTQLIQAIAEAIGAPKPLVVPEWMFAVTPYARSILRGDMRVSNALAKSELGWQQAVPNYREGVARMARHYAQVK